MTGQTERADGRAVQDAGRGLRGELRQFALCASVAEAKAKTAPAQKTPQDLLTTDPFWSFSSQSPPRKSMQN